MKKITILFIASLIALFFSLNKIDAQSFTSGNVVVLVVTDSSSNNTTGSIIEVDKTDAGQPAVTTHAISGTSSTPIRFSGSAGTTMYLANSNDATLVCFSGSDTTVTTGNSNSVRGRRVGTFSSNGTFTSQTTYKVNPTGNQSRGASSIDNSTWYIADQTGLYTGGGTSPSPASNTLCVRTFGGTLYACTSTSVNTAVVGTYTPLTGLSTGTIADFYLISSGSNGSSYDILYTVTSTSNTVGTIAKFCLVSGSWVAKGTYTTTFGGCRIAAETANGGGANIYVSTGAGTHGGNSLVKLFDAVGFNSTIAVTTANNVTLYTTTNPATIKGVAFAPVNNCTAPSITSLTNNSPICEGSALNLTLAVSGSTSTIAWTGPNSFASSSQSPSITTATTAATGTYTVTVTNGCGSTSSTTSATVSGQFTASITPTGTTTICSGNTLTLTASAGTSYSWSTGETTSSIAVSSNGTYSVTISNGACQATSPNDTVLVNPTPAQPGSFTASSANVTTGQTGVAYTVPNDVTAIIYNWNYSGTGATIHGSTNSITIDFSGVATSGTLSVTATNTCGTSTPARTIAITVTQGIQPFTSGNLVVLDLNNNTNTTGSILEFNKTAAAQTTPVSAHAIPSTGTDPVIFSNSGTTGFLATSNDGTLLCISGSDTATSNINNGAYDASIVYKRAICTFNSAGTYSVSTTYTGIGGSTANQARGASSIDNSNFYIADKGGLYTNSATMATMTTNILSAKAFGGVTYVGSASATNFVSTLSSPTATAITGLSGVASNSKNGDFYIVSSGANGSTYDVLYIVSPASATAATILKYALVSGSWVAKSTYTTTFGGARIVAEWNGTGANLYVVSGSGGTTATQIVKLVDASAWNANISVTTANNVVLYTAGAAEIVKGIAFAPVTSTCTAPAITSIGSNTPVCAGSIVNLNLAVTGTTPTFAWTGPNSFASSVQSPSITSSTTAATGTYTVTVTNGCGSTSATTAVVVSSPATAAITPGNDTTFCSGSLTLTSSAGTSYNWSTGATTSSIVVTSSGTYSVTVSNGSCNAVSAPVNVTVKSTPNKPAAFTTSSSNVVKGTSGVLYGVPNDPNVVTYNWSYGGTGATIHGNTDSVTIDFSATATSGMLSVTATNSCGTSTADTMSVAVIAFLPLVRITEYMYSGANGEFIEFTNIGNTDVDMAGWSEDDATRTPGAHNLSSFGLVHAGESVILTEADPATFRTTWNLCQGIKIVGPYTSDNLGRADEINLYDAGGNQVDRLTFDDQTLGGPRANAKSAWVQAAGLGANNSTKWTLSATGDGEGSFASTGGDIGNPGKSTRATVSFDPCFVANGTPTIVVNVATTTNYLDGGVATPPPSLLGFSGVISDPTDPAANLGIDFTIGDDTTPVDDLIVTVVSSNLDVVPADSLVLTGTGASRNLKIKPANIGYSNITITVNDGTLNGTYIINFAASSSSPIINLANTFWHTGMSDGSDGIPLDDDYYMSGDDELDVINVYSRNHSGLPFVSYNYASNLNLPDPSNPEVDVEAATRSTAHAGRVYWTGSMSNGSNSPFPNKPNRDRMFATDVTGTGAATQFTFAGYVNIRTALLAWGDANGYNFTSSAADSVFAKSLAGFSLEGMVFGPDGTTLYLGLRAPLVPTTFRHKALIAPLLNFEAWFNNGNPTGDPTFGAPIELDLDFRGIRDMIRLSNGTYILVAGSPIDDGGVNNIYKWSGNPGDVPVSIANSAGDILNIEGLMQVNEGGQLSSSELQIITDGGAANLYNDNSEAKDFSNLNLRKFRSDVLTGLDLNMCTGFAAGIQADGDTALWAVGSVTLEATNTGASYLWSSGETTKSINPSTTGSYSVTVSVNGCAGNSRSITVIKALPADINGDHIVTVDDFLLLVGKFDQSCACPEDIDGSGHVDVNDFLIMVGEFNHSCN